MLSLSSTNRNPLQSTYTLTPGKRTTGEAPVETHDESADPDTLHPSPSAATRHLLSLVGVDDRALSEASGATPLSAPEVASEEYFRAGDRFLKLQRLDNSGEDSQPAIGHVEARLPTGGRDILREQTMVAFYEGARSDGWMTQTTSSSAKASLPAVTIHEHQTIEGGRYESARLEIVENGSYALLRQEVVDLAHLDESHRVYWLVR